MLTKHRGVFRTSKEELFAKTINRFKRLNVFATCSIANVCYGSEYVYEEMFIYQTLNWTKFNLELLVMDNLTQQY